MIKSTSIPRRWGDALRKVEEEGACRYCGSRTDYLEAAHVIARRCDPILSGPRGGQYRYVHPDSIVPLCGAFSLNKCHEKYDRHELDLLTRLKLHEEVRAVEDAGGIMGALKRVGGPNG